RHSPAGLAATTDHPTAGDRACGHRDRDVWRSRYRCPVDPEPGGVVAAAIVRGDPAGDVHLEPGQDGRVREWTAAPGRGVDDGGDDSCPQRMAAGDDRQRVALLIAASRRDPASVTGIWPS